MRPTKQIEAGFAEYGSQSSMRASPLTIRSAMTRIIETPMLFDDSSEQRAIKLSLRPFPLTSTDCHNAMLSTIEKARHLALGIAERKKWFFFRRSPKDTTLQDACAEFDELLDEINHQFNLAIFTFECVYLDVRETDLLQSLVGLDKDFLDSSGTYLVVFKHC